MCLFCFVSGGLYTCVLLVFKSIYLIWPTFVCCSYYGICVACMQRVKHANYYSLDVRVHCGVSNRCSVLSLSVISTSHQRMSNNNVKTAKKILSSAYLSNSYSNIFHCGVQCAHMRSSRRSSTLHIRFIDNNETGDFLLPDAQPNTMRSSLLSTVPRTHLLPFVDFISSFSVLHSFTYSPGFVLSRSLSLLFLSLFLSVLFCAIRVNVCNKS